MLTCPIIKSILFTGSAKDNGIGMINTPHWVCMQKIETMNHILCYISKANYFCQKEIFMASHSPYGTLEKNVNKKVTRSIALAKNITFSLSRAPTCPGIW